MTRIYRSISVGSLISLVLMLALPLRTHEINAGQADRAARKALSELALRATPNSVDICLSVKTPEGHTLARVFPLQNPSPQAKTRCLCLFSPNPRYQPVRNRLRI